MSRESLSAVLRSSPCFLIQIFYGGQKGKLHGKLSVANEDLSHDTRKWSGRMNSEGESCHSGKLHLPFALAGVRQGAPQATQVANRFHMYKNLVEAVELTLARCRAEIRKNAREAIQEELHEAAPESHLLECAEVISVENWKPAPELCDERARLSRRAQRYDRYQQVMALREQGLGVTEIARRVGLSRRTLERWIKEGDFPETKRRRKRRSVFDPYAGYVLKRWEQGCENGLQLWQEIKEQGYQGSAKTVYRFLTSLRKKQRIIWKPEVPHAPLQDFSANDAVWLFARDQASLDEKEQETLR